jgi:hypothetical protein
MMRRYGLTAVTVRTLTVVSAGHFNGDAFTDLAVGCPGEDVSGNSDLGGAIVLPGLAR